MSTARFVSPGKMLETSGLNLTSFPKSWCNAALGVVRRPTVVPRSRKTEPPPRSVVFAKKALRAQAVACTCRAGVCVPNATLLPKRCPRSRALRRGHHAVAVCPRTLPCMPAANTDDASAGASDTLARWLCRWLGSCQVPRGALRPGQWQSAWCLRSV